MYKTVKCEVYASWQLLKTRNLLKIGTQSVHMAADLQMVNIVVCLKHTYMMCYKPFSIYRKSPHATVNSIY